jgi:hypothetical protein
MGRLAPHPFALTMQGATGDGAADFVVLAQLRRHCE